MFLSRKMRVMVMALGLLGFVLPLTAPASESGTVFSKRRDLPLLESDNASAKTVAKAEWNEALTVSTRKGRWLKVASKDGEGWVYAGNVAIEKLPEENKNDVPIKASGLTASAAGRGLSAGASQYADRRSLHESAEQVKWAEKLNLSISREDATAYLKAHKLGEFSATP